MPSLIWALVKVGEDDRDTAMRLSSSRRCVNRCRPSRNVRLLSELPETQRPHRLVKPDKTAWLVIGFPSRAKQGLGSEDDDGRPTGQRAVAKAANVPLLNGQYRLGEPIGIGGMGTVFRAMDLRLQREVAIKFLQNLFASDRAARERFEREATTTARVAHANVVVIYDVGHDGGHDFDGRPFFVMEYVAGVPITDYCDAHRLPTRARMALVAQICGAIHHAHQKGIIHRDVKPSNVLVTEQDGTPTPKVIDFGMTIGTMNGLSGG